MKIIAIDPGMSGAYAILDVSNHDGTTTLIDACDLPTMGAGTKREMNGSALFHAVSGHVLAHAYIENVFAMPSIPDEKTGKRRGMGAASAFKFGMGVGAVRTVIQCVGIPYRLIVPRVWKKYFALVGPDKEQSRQMAIRCFPRKCDLFARKMDHQRAEAALLGLYAARELAGLAGAV